MISVIYLKKDLLIGGTELLVERTARCFRERGYNTNIVCETVVSEIQSRYSKNNVEICKVESWDSKRIHKALARFSDNQCFVISFAIEDFCMAYTLRKKNLKTLLYTVYFDQLIIGGETHSGLGLNIVKNCVSKLINEMFETGNFSCMDEHTVQNTKKYYGENNILNEEKIPFIRIPVDIIDISDDSLRHKAEIKGIKILTIARADFPWKGYIIGLIHFINDNYQKYDVYLHIVTYGRFEKDIKQEIDKQDIEARNRITIQGKTDYDKLEELYGETNLYIGQGTTVLDSAQRGIVTIPVVPDTYEVNAAYFFHDDYRRVTVPSGNYAMFESLINEFDKMNPCEYYEKALQGRKLVIEHYGTQEIVSRLIDTYHRIPDNTKQSKNVDLFTALKVVKRIVRFA